MNIDRLQWKWGGMLSAISAHARKGLIYLCTAILGSPLADVGFAVRWQRLAPGQARVVLMFFISLLHRGVSFSLLRSKFRYDV